MVVLKAIEIRFRTNPAELGITFLRQEGTLSCLVAWAVAVLDWYRRRLGSASAGGVVAFGGGMTAS